MSRRSPNSNNNLVVYEPLIVIPDRTSSNVPPWTKLAQVNKQIQGELETSIEHFRIKHPQPCYKLDIMIDKSRLYPTWLYFPYASERVETLSVDVRLFLKHDLEGELALTAEQQNFFFPRTNMNEGFPKVRPLASTLLTLLRDFLLNKDDQFNNHHPRQRRHQQNYNGETPSPRSIGKLIINVQIPDDKPNDDMFWSGLLGFWLDWIGVESQWMASVRRSMLRDYVFPEPKLLPAMRYTTYNVIRSVYHLLEWKRRPNIPSL